jgi:hypothetical protein
MMTRSERELIGLGSRGRGVPANRHAMTPSSQYLSPRENPATEQQVAQIVRFNEYRAMFALAALS